MGRPNNSELGRKFDTPVSPPDKQFTNFPTLQHILNALGGDNFIGDTLSQDLEKDPHNTDRKRVLQTWNYAAAQFAYATMALFPIRSQDGFAEEELSPEQLNPFEQRTTVPLLERILIQVQTRPMELGENDDPELFAEGQELLISTLTELLHNTPAK
jgi:hypothetical protein